MTALALGAVVVAPACGGCSESPRVEQDRLVRERVYAAWDEDKFPAARELLRPLVERKDAEVADLVWAGCIELEDTQPQAALPLLERALREAPDDPAVVFNLARCHRDLAEDFALVVELMKRAHELAPADIPTELHLARAYFDLAPILEADGRMDEAKAALADAEKHYRHIVERGVDVGGKWYVSALYQYGQLLFQDGRTDEGEAKSSEHARLASTLGTPSTIDWPRGSFGVLAPPTPPPAPEAEAPVLPQFADPADFVTLEGVHGLAVADVVVPLRAADTSGASEGPARPQFVEHALGPPDLLAWGPSGVWLVERGGPNASAARWTARRIFDGPTERLATADLDRDGDLDAWIVSEGRVRLCEYDAGALKPSARTIPATPSEPSDLAVFDYDHEGDLDLLLVGPFGYRVWRDDTPHVQPGGSASQPPSAPGGFSDATSATGLAAAPALNWCAVEDFDVDQDVDFVAGSPSATLLADSLRQERFADRSADLPAGASSRGEPWIADLDLDARPDLVFGGQRPVIQRGLPSGRYADAQPAAPIELVAGRGGIADVNLDGRADLVGISAGGRAVAVLSIGTAAALTLEIGPAEASLQVDCGDLDGDLVPDVARLTERGIAIHRGNASERRAIRLALQGVSDTSRGLGAVVEIRGRNLYRRIWWRGEPLVIGLDRLESLNIVRSLWPNGVHGRGLDAAAGREWLLIQRDGRTASCPLLYAWNGTSYGFVTDVLGITPLGLPMAPGMLVPPDHDEYVLVRGEQLVPRKGADGRPELALQFTEELREVAYLDRARLDVIDHPADVEVFPNERFTFPPFPEPHVHTVVDPLVPTRAMGSDGRDWAAELARDDAAFAVPFRPYRWTEEGQYLGLATPHWIELEFDAERTRAADKLRLVMNGWFYWTNASVNMASARTESVRFVPPMLELQAEDGTWQPVGPPLGFPAGMLKTMVVDVTDRVPRENPRFRISSTLYLVWDSIRLAVDADDAPVRVTAIEPARAELYERGFSRTYDAHGPLKLLTFDWDGTEPFVPWDQHPGSYTRFGDVRPLLGDVDDRYAILGSGDAIDLRFDASGLPPVPEGWKRDYLLFLDGWAKDRDPNTIEALYVEPLPFHGMSGYPYRADESFPDDDEHRKWRAEWNTRPARRWVESLAPEPSTHSAP